MAEFIRVVNSVGLMSLYVVDSTFGPVTGLSATAAVQRSADGLWYTWVSGVWGSRTEHALTETATGCYTGSIDFAAADRDATGTYLVFYSITGVPGDKDMDQWLLVSTADSTSPIFTPPAPSGVLGMTFEDIQASVDLHLQRAYGDDARYVTETLRDQWINAAYHQIDMALEWTRSTYGFTTTVNVEGYTVPDYVRYIDIVSMVDANDKLTQLREINHQEYIQKCIASTGAGIPQFYLRRGGEIILYPMPDASTYDVTLYIITDAADLSNASDIPPWPVHTHQLVVDMVLAYAARYYGAPDKAIQYRQYVKECIREEMREPAADRSEPQRIVNTMF